MLRRLEPLSWLLVAVAGWALACVVVAMSGFGGRYTLLPDNPSLVPSLPASPTTASRSTMGPLDAYAEAFNHPLFFPDRKPAAAHVPGQSAASAQPLDVVLTSVIMTPTLQMAIVQDPKSKASLRVREGQPLGGAYAGWKLSGLSPRSATFDSDSQGQTTLDLRVFDGKGGEEPTRNGLTPQVVASGALGVPPGRRPMPMPPAPMQKDAQPDAADADAANTANNVAAQAAQQAEEIRRRIELRRQQAQSQLRSQQ